MDPARSPALSSRSLSISSATGPRTSGQFPPLSSHGMPKEPSLLSPNGSITRPHRFSGLSPTPRSPRPTEPPMSPVPALSPGTSGPMSPPMSARSFGTFIDSEPSTPAYSPRMDSNWDGSTLVLLQPFKAKDASPSEPTWDVMAPLQKPPKKRFSRHRTKLSINKDTSTAASLPSHPVVTIQEEGQKEEHPAAEEEQEKKEEEGQATQGDALGKLASRMKSLLKRSSNSEKKKEKRQRYELDRVETLHWTEL